MEKIFSQHFSAKAKHSLQFHVGNYQVVDALFLCWQKL